MNIGEAAFGDQLSGLPDLPGTVLALVDAQGFVLGWSPGAGRLVGRSAVEVLGRRAADLLFGSMPVEAGRSWMAGDEWHGKLQVRHRDGYALNLHVSAYPLAADGTVACWLLLAVDRGPLPREDEEALVDWLFSRSPVALTVYDTDLRARRQNAQMMRLSGMSEASRHGLSLSQVLTGSDAQEWQRQMRRVLQTGETVQGELRGRTPADPDHDHVFSAAASVLRDRSGRVLGVCSTVEDITEQHRNRERLALLNEASVRIGTTLDVMSTAQELVDVVVPRLADWASVDLVESLLSGDEPVPGPVTGNIALRRVAHQSILEGVPESVTRLGEIDVYTEHSPPARCLFTGLSLLYPRVDDPVIRDWMVEDPARGATIRRYGFHSFMTVPVRARGLTLGVVVFVRSRTNEPFKREDVILAEEVVARAAVCLDNARRFTRERTAALVLQQSLLPRRLPERAAIEVASRYLPAGSQVGVGGDWFDVVPLSGARVGLVVGDVVGHGMHAAATMGRLRTAVRTLADVDLTPDELLTQLDDLVIRLSNEEDTGDAAATAGGIGATCLYAIYDPVSRRCSLARAGHPPPAIVVPGGTADFLNLPPGPPLGLGGLPFEASEIDIPEDSLLVLYTDGLVESRDYDIGDGMEALRRALAVPSTSLEAVADTVLKDVLPKNPSDDAALLVARPRALDAGQVATWDLSDEPAVVAHARAEASRQLTTWGLEEASFVTELVVSELVTNALRYGGAPIRLRLIRDITLICEVSDASSTAPHLRRARAFDEGGRGLLLVAQLTQRWGTRQGTNGKTIWCEQALPTGGTI